MDVFNADDQAEIVNNEHCRAHRSYKENIQQILKDYFFPNMQKMVKELIHSCEICRKAKYERHPVKTKIGNTPIPTYCGQILHMDIYSTDNNAFLTCLDKFTKFAVVQSIKSRAIVDIIEPMMLLLGFFRNVRIIVCDNEPSLNSQTIKNILSNRHQANIHPVPPSHSTSNGQIERFHSTLTEISRCIKMQENITSTAELVQLAVFKYNRSIHSVTGCKPIDLVHSMPENIALEIQEKLNRAQQDSLNFFNKNRHIRAYNIGEEVYVRTNRRIGNKFRTLYEKKVIQEDLRTKVKIDGRLVHKDNLRL